MASRRKSKIKDTDKTDAAGDFEIDSTDDASKPVESADEPVLEPFGPEHEQMAKVIPVEKAKPKPKPEPIPETDPHPGLPRVPLRVYLKLAGLKPDQLAGFKRYATTQKLGPMPVPAWREAHKAFRNKPTN